MSERVPLSSAIYIIAGVATLQYRLSIDRDRNTISKGPFTTLIVYIARHLLYTNRLRNNTLSICDPPYYGLLYARPKDNVIVQSYIDYNLCRAGMFSIIGYCFTIQRVVIVDLAYKQLIDILIVYIYYLTYLFQTNYLYLIKLLIIISRPIKL